MAMARGSFTLVNGREIALQSLDQWTEYAGLLEGLPTRRRNDARLRALIEKAQRRDGHAPFLITPEQKPISYDGDYPFGEPASLPVIGCIGRFVSRPPARDSSMDGCGLTIIWFQDDYAFPLSPDAEHAILTVDWEALAHDYEY